MRKIKLFLASSSELIEDREQFEIFIYRRCKAWANEIFLHLDKWEDFSDAMSLEGLQGEYNQVVRDCDIFVLLVQNKVGQYTAEEFEQAYQQFAATTKKPLIFTYFKPPTAAASAEGLASVEAFDNRLKGLNHYKTAYPNIEGLREHFGNQLDKLAAADFAGLGSEYYTAETITSAPFVLQSVDYQALAERIAEQQEMIEAWQATGKTERALKAANKLAQLEEEREQFKENVFKLYETFSKVEIDTARLAQAKAHFDKGEFREADAVLNAEEMAKDLDRLIERDQQLDKEKAAVAKDRGQLSNEYLVKARLRATFYEQPNRFVEVCQYFEEALKAARTTEAVFEYGVFLQKHNDFKRAKPLYVEALHHYRELAKELHRIYFPDVAMTLNNLAILQSAQNKYAQAASSYDEALNHYRELARENPRTYLPHVAVTLNNVGLLQEAQHDYEKAASSYNEALRIRRELVKENPRTYLPHVAVTLNNLAILQKAQHDYEKATSSYDEALRSYRELVKENPRTYLPYVATTLNNLAVLQKAQHDYEKATSSYDEALRSYRELVKENPRTYLPYVAMTLNNLAVLQKAQHDYEKATSSYDEALRSYRKLAKENPRTYLPDVATTLNNLANLQSDQNDYEKAASSYDETLRSYRKLAKENPRTYLPDVAMTLVNLSIFYLQDKPDKAKSVAMAKEVIQIAEGFPQVPIVQQRAEKARLILQANEAK